MAGVITASEPSWTGPFTGLSPRQFNELITALRREGAGPVRRGRPWSLPLQDRTLLVAAYWRTNLTLRRLAPLFGAWKPAADRIVDHLGPALALQHRGGSAGTPCSSWTARWSPVGTTPAVIADGGYRGTGLTIPHYRRHKDEELLAWKEQRNASHRRIRARVEHAFARMESWKILRDCRLRGEGVHHAVLGIARLHNLALTGWQATKQVGQQAPEHLRDDLYHRGSDCQFHEYPPPLLPVEARSWSPRPVVASRGRPVVRRFPRACGSQR
ncbi:hypothetical protein SUDANB176_00107 [Streptomyces sp. enrichment culture]